MNMKFYSTVDQGYLVLGAYKVIKNEYVETFNSIIFLALSTEGNI